MQQPERVNVLARYSQLSATDMPSQYEVTHFISADTVLRRDAPTFIGNVVQDERLTESLRQLLQQLFGAVSTLFVPLVVSGQWMGFIHAVYHEQTQFSDAEMRRLMSLAGQAAVVAQSIRLLEETQGLLESEQRQRRIADTLVQAAARMTGILDEQEIRHILIDEINSLIRPDQVSLYVWSEDDNCLRLDHRILASPEDTEDDYQPNQSIKPKERPDLWAVFQRNEPLLEAARQTDEYFREHYCVPWLVGGQVAGLIEAYHTARYLAIRDTDQRAVEDMVRQADLRIQNARLFAQSRRRAEELTILNEMGRNLTVTRDVAEVVENIYSYTNRLMDAQNFYVALYHPENNAITFPLARDEGEEIELASRPFGEGATEYVIQSGQPLLIEDGVARWLDDHGFSPAGAVAQSWLGIPLTIGNEVIGAIAVRSSTPYVYDDNHQNLLIAISGQSAIAIQNARLFAQTQEQLADLTTIQQTTAGLTAANNLEGAVNVLLPQVVTAVQADSARLFLVEGENGVRVGMYPPEPDEAVHLIMPLDRHPMLKQAVETGQPVAVSVNDADLPEHTRQVFLATGLTATAVIPLVGGEGLMGLLLVGSHDTEKVFVLDEIGLLQTLADQATIAFERVRLLEDAQRRARREQVLREITGRVRSSADIDTIMKTAVQEIGQALGRETFIRLAGE
jgi:GAF domain-containing protein